MSEFALMQLFEYIKSEIARGDNWRERITNNTKYKILEGQYDNLPDLLNKAEEQMQGMNMIKHFITKEIRDMVGERKRANSMAKIPFFDEVDREVKRVKTRLTYHDIPDYDSNAEYLDDLIKDLIVKEAEKHGLEFRG